MIVDEEITYVLKSYLGIENQSNSSDRIYTRSFEVIKRALNAAFLYGYAEKSKGIRPIINGLLESNEIFEANSAGATKMLETLRKIAGSKGEDFCYHYNEAFDWCVDLVKDCLNEVDNPTK